VRMLEVSETHLHPGVYSPQEVADTLGVSLAEMFSRYDPLHLGDPSGTESRTEIMCGTETSAETMRQSGGYKLLDRSLHVYAEANRVLEFRRVCESDHVDGEVGCVCVCVCVCVCMCL
jgi:hypothetical protein